MAITIKKPGDENHLIVELIERDGQVVLSAYGHELCIIRTDSNGVHKIELYDIDAGIIASRDVRSMVWRR